MALDARKLLAAWRAARQEGVDPFSSSAPETLPRVRGWSVLRLPERELAQTRVVTLLDALRALSLNEREMGRPQDRVQLAATLPLHAPNVLQTRDALRDLVNMARTELLVIGYAIADDHLRELLIQRARQGVTVSIVGDRESRAARDLKAAWPQDLPLTALEHVEGSTDTASLHAKVLVADRSIALMGAANFTVSGMTRCIDLCVRIEGASATRMVELVEQLRGDGWLVPVES